MNTTARRLSYYFLCIFPVIAIGFAGPRVLRVAGEYQVIGGALFVCISVAAWILGSRWIFSGGDSRRSLALAATFLLVPLALISLFWVGLATPWDATPPENVMRYYVLLASSIAVATGFVILRDTLSDAGERFYSSLGFALAVFAGAGYMVWNAFQVGFWEATVHLTKAPPELASMNVNFDILLDTSCVLTYLSAAAFAASLGKAGWLGRWPTRTYVSVNLIAVLLLWMRGSTFPDPTALATPWYTQPGFIVGIPAVPWLIPFLLGVVLLRRAGNEET